MNSISNHIRKQVDNTPRLNKNFLIILLLPLLIIGLGIAVFNVARKGGSFDIRNRASGNPVLLGFSQGSVSVNNGDTVSVGLTLNMGSDNVTATEIHLTYDQNALEAQNITAGNFLPVVLVNGTLANGYGSIILGCDPEDSREAYRCNPPSTVTKQTAGILATLTFKARNPSISNISYTTQTQVAALGNESNVLSSFASLPVSVFSPTTLPSNIPTLTPTNTPIPTSTPTHTPTPTTIPTITPTPTDKYSNYCLNKLTGSCPLPYGGIGICVNYVCIPNNTTPTVTPSLVPTVTSTPNPTQTPLPTPTVTPVPATIYSNCPLKSKGDANCDGKISIVDMEIFRREFNYFGSGLNADFNGDGRISIIDYEILRRNFI